MTRWLPVLSLVCCIACGGTAPPVDRPVTSPEVYPGALVASQDIQGQFMWRQRVHARYLDGQEGSFEAVVQKQGDELTVMGLTPFGSQAFVLIQRGQQVSSQGPVDERLPFPPRFVLVDVHRVFFADRDWGVGADGWRERERDGERVRELWKAGRLSQRKFERLDGQPAGAIVVRYEPPMAPGVPTARVVLDNGWFRYQLTIQTISAQPL